MGKLEEQTYTAVGIEIGYENKLREGREISLDICEEFLIWLKVLSYLHLQFY